MYLKRERQKNEAERKNVFPVAITLFNSNAELSLAWEYVVNSRVL